MSGLNLETSAELIAVSMRHGSVVVLSEKMIFALRTIPFGLTSIARTALPDPSHL
jgi:hypothetical protein